jgi:hypothetical protein
VPNDQKPAHSLAAVIRFIILTLTRWARQKTFGEIVITCQAGQIITVRETTSHQAGELPSDERHPDQEARTVAERAASVIPA